MKYQDLSTNSASANATIFDIETQPTEGFPADQFANGKTLWAADYGGKFPRPSAAAFAAEGAESVQNFNSLVGFEKDPWTIAYVKVSAKTSPKMLFSPFTSGDKKTVTLTAEAYAMPFAGRIGPWYFDGWPAGAPSSMSANQVDALLPPRYDMQFDPVNNYRPPNFSRYPGDQLGMQSALAQNSMLQTIHGPDSNVWPHSQNSQYAQITNANFLNLDPVVPDNEASPVRQAELASIVPSLFDAVYYSVDQKFDTNYHTQLSYGGQNLFDTICAGMCNDLGTTKPPLPPYTVAVHIANAQDTGASKQWWTVKDPNLLNSGWTQQGTDMFGQPPSAAVVGNPKTSGGRTGYSVKIVSKEFLNSGQLPFGGSAGTGPLNNSPNNLGL